MERLYEEQDDVKGLEEEQGDVKGVVGGTE